MSRERLYLFDTTLRDGAQTNGVDFTVHDKKLIAGMLDDLGVRTGIDVDALIEAAHAAAEIVGREIPSRVAVAGPRTRRAGGG